MEPRVFTRGNSKLQGYSPEIHWCFNGATRLHAWKLMCTNWAQQFRAELQWSHASSRVETDGAGTINYGIDQVLQWSHASSRVETSPVEYTKVSGGVASMEPRVFTRGNIGTAERTY